MTKRPTAAPRAIGAPGIGLGLAKHGGREWADVATLTLGSGFTATTMGLALVYCVAIVADVVLIPQVSWLPLAPAVTALVLAGLGGWHRWRRCTGTELGRLAGIAAVVATGNAALMLVAVHEPVFASIVILTLVASGALLPGVRWLMVVDVIAVVGLGVAASGRWDDSGWASVSAALAFAVAVAHLLQVHARRGNVRLQALAVALAYAAQIDALTGLANRQGLSDEVEQMFGPVGQRAPDGCEVTVVCLDVDGFKRINDQLGHATGDALLVEIAARMRELVRVGDVAARLGGDEFALVLGDVGAEAGQRVAERARLRMRGTAGVLDLPWSVSIGTAYARVSNADDVTRLLRQADMAMYEDKRARRGAAPTVALKGR